METTMLKRVFVYKDERIPDPDPLMSADEVIETMSIIKPELACGYIKKSTPNEEDETEMLYEIATNIGTKA